MMTMTITNMSIGHTVVRASRNTCMMHSDSGHVQWAWLRWPTKMHYFLQPCHSNLSSFSPNLIYLPCLQITQVPRCWDQAIFVSMTTTTVTTTMTVPIILPLVHVCGVIKFMFLPMVVVLLNLAHMNFVPSWDALGLVWLFCWQQSAKLESHLDHRLKHSRKRLAMLTLFKYSAMKQN